jgi:hypothetical protein
MDFTVITEEFGDDLGAIRLLVSAFSDRQKNVPKARIAAANSATLLLAATFEEFVREMARSYAKTVVAATSSIGTLPPKLANTVWRRTMEALARVQIDTNTKAFSTESVFSDAQTRFNVVYEFCKGDLSQDVYDELIYNENNMRPREINSLFKVSGLNDVCSQIADKEPLLENLGETEPGKAHGQLLVRLEEFFERRNGIAHSLNPARSSGPDQIAKDIDLLSAFGKSLCETLEVLAPKATATAGATPADVAQVAMETPAVTSGIPAQSE